MNTPGVSLFQGADTLKVNSTLDRQEEEEALQDQKRREAELGNLLENAFDDLEDDDEENTIDSTSSFPSNLLPNGQGLPLPLLPMQQTQQQQQADCVNSNEIHELKMMLESRTKEAHNKIDECQKRLFITQAELERALREKQHTHELLVDSKEKCSNLDSNIEKLRCEKRTLETENTQLVGKLETAHTLLADVQRKYDMVERDQHRREDRNADIRIKQLEDQQRAQIELMQQKVNQLSDQLDKKKQELEQMHVRYNALQSSYESMLLDKADKINELNSALDVAQRRCHQLAAKPNYEAENSRQQQCIADLHAQVASMEQTIAQLTERVNGTAAELDLMDTLIQQHQSETDSPNRLPSRLAGSTPLNPTDRMGHIKQELYRALVTLKNKREEVRRLEKLLDERTKELRTLREEENKTLVQLANLKEDKSRLETRIKGLQEQLDERQHNSSLNVSKLQAELDVLLAEKDALHQQTIAQATEQQRLDKQLKQAKLDLEHLKLEHEQLKRQHDQLTDDNRQLRTRPTADNLRLELERYKILLNDAQGEVKRLKSVYTDIANEKETLNFQLRKLSETDSIKELQEHRQQIAQLQRNMELAELKAQELSKILDTAKLQHERDLETLREKWEREKYEEVIKAAKKSSSNCTKCSDQLADITKIEIQLLKMQNMNSMQAKELNELRNELEQSKALRAELETKVQQMAEQEKLLSELKVKAQLYEEQLQQEAVKLGEQLSPSQQIAACSAEASGGSNTPPELTQSRIKRIEQRVRDEMAKLFATELKRFTLRVQQAEERSVCLQREYQLVCRDLQHRQTEVDLLKQTILAEREQMQQLLGEQEEKQKQMLHKCRSELQTKNQRISDLLRELDEQHASIESERRSMKAVMNEWDKQKQSIEQVEQHWRAQVQTLRETHEEAMRAAQQRYQSAKRTAHNYKIYAEDKDAHMKREYERIKIEYQTSLTQIEATMQKHLQRKSRDRNQKRSANDKENESNNH
ncbi:putative leucine-rich repeat-containing protein DDB_G0290503 isoform X2 [Drosophila hydei]|uniref:Leucine-rich repeat-containing protein DDB_G0290503 isoform X2 n=1 Tax=Drosophila hydei TaxID=7224 RepID=A0A6J2SP20_DROHY|nr:putative leucine-rich repeat-containing protein DDB_G0290503 isoform X2 [Drosophila hydei]